MVGRELHSSLLGDELLLQEPVDGTALGGLSFGGISYAGRDGGRLWLEAEVAFNRPLPFGIGLAGGVVAEVDPVAEPRLGLQGTLWVYAGVIPYLRVGTVDVSGEFVEVGLMIKIPAVRFF